MTYDECILAGETCVQIWMYQSQIVLAMGVILVAVIGARLTVWLVKTILEFIPGV